MDLVLSTFGEGELEQLPKFQSLLKKLSERLDDDGRLKANADRSDKLERDAMEAQSVYMKQLVVYRCLLAISAGDVEDDCPLPEETRTTLSDLLAAWEWDTLKEASPDKALYHHCLSSDAKLPSDFYETVGECVRSKLENIISKLVELSGESDKQGLVQRLETILASRDEIASLERTRCNLIISYQKTLLDYLKKLSKYCDEFIFTEELERQTAKVDWFLVKVDALMLKANLLELQIHCAVFTKERIGKLSSIRNEQLQLRAELEDQISTAKGELEAYEDVAGPDYDGLVKEYGLVQDEIEKHIWALRELVTDSGSPSS